MKKRLSIATVLIDLPRILLLDEPFAALDLIAKQDITNFLKSFREGGGITIIASHDENTFSLCDDIYLLKDGTLRSLPPLTGGETAADLLRS